MEACLLADKHVQYEIRNRDKVLILTYVTVVKKKYV